MVSRLWFPCPILQARVVGAGQVLEGPGHTLVSRVLMVRQPVRGLFHLLIQSLPHLRRHRLLVQTRGWLGLILCLPSQRRLRLLLHARSELHLARRTGRVRVMYVVECVEVHLRVRHFYNAMNVDLGSAGHVDIGAHSVPGGIWFVIHVITGGAICGGFLTRHGGVVHAISGDRHHSLFIASPHAC